jgi:DNA-binding MarR family transcriptional regulator/N-acetylglutamate synthase-like GNAT family acetyltransferase
MPTAKLDPTVEAVRAFNRFYTHYLGLLDERHLGSDLSLTAVRLLYELAHDPRESSSASEIARGFGLDTGYVSRLVESLDRKGLIAKAKTPDDARRTTLRLSAAGRRAVARFEATTREHLATLLHPLSREERRELVGAMKLAQRLLGGADVSTVDLRPPRPGDLGHVIERQAALYAEEYGWDWTYEGLIAGICAGFVEHFDAAHERCWIADRDGIAVGSVFVVRKSATVAQLRLLYVEPSARGLGIGRRLVEACIAFARAAGYRKMMLWTNDVLVSARRIYEAAGFVLVEEERHHSFGKDLVGQNWSLRLR